MDLAKDPLLVGYVKRFKVKSSIETEYDAIVIGSGPGGLATASLLSQYGYRVCVLESHDRVGGGTHEFQSHGYSFDTGFHYIGEMTDPRSPLRRMYNFVAAEPVHFEKLDECPHLPGLTDVVYVLDEHKQFLIPSGAAPLQQELCKHFPSDVQTVKSYFADCTHASSTLALRFVSQSMAGAGLLYDWLSRLLLRPFLGFARQTLLERLSSKHGVHDSRLSTLLGYLWGCHGSKPRDCSFFVHGLIQEHFVGGASYCRPQLLSRSMAATIDKHGGQVFVNACVDRILLNHSDSSVRGVSVRGVEVRAPIVVSSTGVHHTFDVLLNNNQSAAADIFNQFWDVPVSKPANGEAGDDDPVARLLQTRGGPLKLTNGHVCLFVGLRGTTDELKLPRANTWVLPSLHSTLYNDMVDEYRASDKGECFLQGNRFPYLGIGFPSAKDLTYAERHPGKSCCIVILESPSRWWGGAGALTKLSGRRGSDHEQLKLKFQRRMLECLFDRFPQLQDRVDHVELGTPLDNRRWLGKPAGDSYGLEPTPLHFLSTQSQLTPTVRSHKGLFLTGQDISLDGFAGALTGGYCTAGAILGPLRFWVYILFKVIGLGPILFPPKK